MSVDSILICLMGALMGTLMGVLILLMMRNRSVRDFRVAINHSLYEYQIAFLNSLKDDDELRARESEWEGIKKKADDIWKKYKYDDMLYSLKPLTLESWYEGEELSIIVENINYKQG